MVGKKSLLPKFILIGLVSFISGLDFIQCNPHNSFAPYRTSTAASWFVDGENYMEAVANALENAQEEIFIADWWLSPEIYLKRSVVDQENWRLDKILERKAVSIKLICE